MTSLAALISGLTYYHAYFELTENQTVADQFLQERGGPLYSNALKDFEMTLLSSDVTYHGDDGMIIQSDIQKVEIKRGPVPPTNEQLAFNKPLLYGHYRIYLALSQGYSVIFSIENMQGSKGPGVVSLPPYPNEAEIQISDFSIPGPIVDKLAVSIDPDQLPHDPDGQWSMDIPEDPQIEVSYTVDNQRQRSLISLGDSIDIESGTLTFEGVRRWHGFLLDYDPMRPYLLVSVVATIIAISWHYLAINRKRKISSNSRSDTT